MPAYGMDIALNRKVIELTKNIDCMDMNDDINHC